MNTATWTIKRLALIVACLGLLALSPAQRTEAADVSSNGTAQVLWCESMGGTADVQSVRTNADGLTSVVVTCTGGFGGSWHCANFQGSEPDCQASRGSLPDWGDLVDGQILAPLTSSPPASDAGPSVTTADDDQDQSKDNGKKNKKHKKGKNGGKGRKK